MAYEYSGQGSRLDFPNPYYTENRFLASASAISLIGAVRGSVGLGDRFCGNCGTAATD